MALIKQLYSRKLNKAIYNYKTYPNFSVHISNGLFADNGGYEYALTLMVASLALAIQGGGSFSMDKVLSEKLG